MESRNLDSLKKKRKLMSKHIVFLILDEILYWTAQEG